MHIKTTMRCHLTPVRIPTIKRQEITRVGKDVEKSEPLCTVGGNVIDKTIMENSMQVLQKIKNRATI